MAHNPSPAPQPVRWGHWELQQVFEYIIPDIGTLRWDINRARACVTAHPRPAWPIPPHDLAEIVAANTHDPAHLDAVNPAEPGIAAPLLTEGHIDYILIDGHHRAARALRDGLPFAAVPLSDAENRRCLLSAPPGCVP